MEMNKFYRLVLYVLHADKHLLCGSRKYQFRESLEIPRERGGHKDQIVKGKYERKLEFPENWGGGGVGGANQKILHGGSMDLFWRFTFAVQVMSNCNSNML